MSDVDPTAEGYGQFPLRTQLGFDIDHSTPGEAVAWLDVDDRHLNPNGVVHGAVLFALVDTAMGAATMDVVADGCFCASIEIQLRFFSAIPSGRVEAHPSTTSASARIVAISGPVIFTATPASGDDHRVRETPCEAVDPASL